MNFVWFLESLSCNQRTRKKPTPMFPPTYLSQFPFQTHFDQSSYCDTSSLGSDQLKEVKMETMWW